MDKKIRSIKINKRLINTNTSPNVVAEILSKSHEDISSNEYSVKYKFNKYDYWKRKLFNLNNEKIDPLIFSKKKKDINVSKSLFSNNIDVVNIETSSYCNRKCSYCPVAIYGRGEKIFMSNKLLNSILDGLRDIKYKKLISLNLYNEPLSSIEFYKVLRLIKKKLPNAITGTNSNGDYIKNRDDLIRLADSGLNRIKITAHTPPKKSYSKKYMTIRIMDFAKRIDYKLTKENLKNLNFQFKINNLVGIYQCPDWFSSGNSRGGIIKELNKKSLRQKPCVKPFREFTIYYDGTVTPCCDIYHGENYSKHIIKKISDLDKNDIFKIYAGDKLSMWRKSLFSWSEKEDICGSCSAPDLAEKSDQSKRKAILNSLDE